MSDQEQNSGEYDGRDPRLEIPEVLRTPVKKPAMFPQKSTASGGAGFGDLGKGLTIGLDFLFTAAAGGVLGWLFDRWKGSSPTGLLVGLSLGFVMGVYRLIRHLNADNARSSGSKR